MTLEATADPNWISNLSDAEAVRAAEFATLDFKDFPIWLSDLVRLRPAAVRAVLLREIDSELSRSGETVFDTLDMVADSKLDVTALLAPVLLQRIESGLLIDEGPLSRVLKIVVNGIEYENQERFAQIGTMRATHETEVPLVSLFLSAVFSVDPKAATSAFIEKAAAFEGELQVALVDSFLTNCFGPSYSGVQFTSRNTPPPEVIKELMLVSWNAHPALKGKRPPSGANEQEHGHDTFDRSRSELFSRFVSTSGAATYFALRRLQEDPTFPIPSARLRSLAEERASKDSEAGPWLPGEAHAFEKFHETEPRTDSDLRAVLIGRIEDMQHALLNDDFAEGQILKAIRPEREVQKWVAARLRLKQGRSFSVEREPHVVNEKEPDIRIRAKATDANVAIEIKVADDWTLRDLDDALEIQLCERYLRSAECRYGILLLLNQNTRPKGWEDKSVGKFLTFEEVVERLGKRALKISGAGYDSPQPVVRVCRILCK